MADDAIAAVMLRNSFYRDGQRKMITILIFSVIVNFILAGLLGYIITHPPEPRYFATSISGKITPIVALNAPNQSDSAVLQWANQAAIAAFSYNFVNYRSELVASSGFFTAEGWDSQQHMTVTMLVSRVDTLNSPRGIGIAQFVSAPASGSTTS